MELVFRGVLTGWRNGINRLPQKEGRKSKRKSIARNVRGRDGGERKERKKAEKGERYRG